MGAQQSTPNTPKGRRDSVSSSESEGDVLKYKYEPTTEHHLVGKCCGYERSAVSSTGKIHVWVRVCNCGQRTSKKGRIQAGEVLTLEDESDGLEAHFSKRCKWYQIPNCENFDHLVRICKCRPEKSRASGGGEVTRTEVKR